MKAITFVSGILFLAFALIISVLTLQTNRPLALFSSAQEYRPVYCPMNAEIYVHEVDAFGQERPVSIEKYPDIDVLKWSFSDNARPNAQVQYFNNLPHMTYALASDALTFSSLPRNIDVYHKGEKASLTLNYQRELFTIVKQEIASCSSPMHPTLCDSIDEVVAADEGTSARPLETISNIGLDCDMTLKAGWVVKRNAAAQAEAAQANTALAAQCDLNGDNACNTFDLFIVLDTYGEQGSGLKGDLNKDNKVNALDYTLLTSQISLL